MYLDLVYGPLGLLILGLALSLCFIHLNCSFRLKLLLHLGLVYLFVGCIVDFYSLKRGNCHNEKKIVREV